MLDGRRSDDRRENRGLHHHQHSPSVGVLADSLAHGEADRQADGDSPAYSGSNRNTRRHRHGDRDSDREGDPEQTVAGIVFTPEPSVQPGAPDQGGDGWAGSVPAAGDVSTDPADIGGSALAALLLLATMGFVGELFNNTVESNYARIMGFWQKTWLGRLGRAFSAVWGSGSK